MAVCMSKGLVMLRYGKEDGFVVVLIFDDCCVYKLSPGGLRQFTLSPVIGLRS